MLLLLLYNCCCCCSDPPRPVVAEAVLHRPTARARWDVVLKEIARHASPSLYMAQAHVIAIHGDGVHACGAAVVGLNLMRIDPGRPRIALAFNISEDTRTILKAGWTVREGNNGRDPVISKGAVLDVRRGSRLFSRALLWDADHLPLLSAGRQLERLWSFAPDIEALAFGEHWGCFNSGFILYRPSDLRRSEFEQLVGLGPAAKPKGCSGQPNNPNDDQPYFNAVFHDSEYVRRHGGRGVLHAPLRQIREQSNETGLQFFEELNSSIWRMRTPYSLGDGAGTPRCIAHPLELEQQYDSYHFFGRLPPWGGTCAQCALRGLPCHVRDGESARALLNSPASSRHLLSRAPTQ